MNTVVTYNGTSITLEDGQTLTLNCAETVFVSDISISTAAKAIVDYNNETIANLREGQVLTLHCAGFKAKSDISVRCIIAETPDEPEMPEESTVIPAGVYIFNPQPTITKSASWSLQTDTEPTIQACYFNGSVCTSQLNTASITFEASEANNSSVNIKSAEILAGRPKYTTTWWESSSSWDYTYKYSESGSSRNGRIIDTYLLRCRTITVTADTLVDLDFYEVFMANVTKES